MLISTIDHSPYLGRLGIGRIERGTVHVGDTVALLAARHEPGDRAARASRSCTSSRDSSASRSRRRPPARSWRWPGSRASRSGSPLTDVEHPERLEGIAVEEPTISVDFIVNNSPFAGKEGKFVTSRQVRERLYQGARAKRRAARRGYRFDGHVDGSGRGELHLTILMETMRREGYEFQVSRPRVITREGLERRASRAVRGADDRRARGAISAR